MSSQARSVRLLTLVAALLMPAVLLPSYARAENQSLETLLAYLKSPNFNTRRDAARKLGERRVRNQLAVEALTVAGREDVAAVVRAEAVKSLGLIKDFSAVPDMIRMLADPDTDVRLITVRSLVALYTEHDIDFITNRRIGWNRLNPFLDTSDHEIVEPYILVDPNITNAIGDSARRDRNLDVRIAAVRAAGVLRGGNAIDQLADALASDHELRMEVLRAFIKIGDPSAGRHLVPFFNDSDRTVRTQAMVAAGMLKYRAAVEPLTSVYRLGPEEKGIFKKVTDKVKGRFTYLPPRDEAALWALSLIGDRRAEKIFVENLASKDGDRRQYAVEGLGRMGDVQYGDRIAEMIRHEDNGDVRLAAYWATYKLGSSPNLNFVVNKLDTDQHDQARDYLIEANNPADLFPYVRSASVRIRRRVIDILGQIGDRDTIRELEPVTRTSSAETADVAIVAIKRIEWRLAGRPRAGNSPDHRDSPSRASNQE
jgi:HEAT repeat protein